MRARALVPPSGRYPSAGVPFSILKALLLVKRSRAVLGRSVATRRFEHSNPKLLALEICGDMAVFVVRNISAMTYMP